MNILLFGPPGAGKGTQSALLKSNLSMVHISTGDLFRAAIKNETSLGREAKGYLDKGALVPDSITIGLIQEVFKHIGGGSFVLDGFPRTVPQAEALDTLLTHSKLKLGAAIFIDVPYSELTDRLTGRRVCSKCGATYHVSSSPPKSEGACDNCGGGLAQRSDDRPDVIGNRLKAYEDSTRPLKEFYKGAGKLVEIDGLGDTAEVFSRICKVLDS